MLLKYDEDKITKTNQTVIQNLKKVMARDIMGQDNLKSASVTALTFGNWLNTVINVYEKLLIVNPKREELRIATQKSEEAETQLNEKKNKLQLIMDKIAE